MALMTVTFGANQHVSGIGLTIGLIGLSEFTNRLIFAGGELQQIEPMPIVNPFGGLGEIGAIFDQYALTWVAFLVVVPAAWWLLQRSSFGLEIRAVGENPEAADAAGVNVARTRYLALMIGGALMAIGGAFITLALLGSFTLDIIAGRGWVCVALVIFGRWRIGRGVIGALLFSLVFSLQFRLRILPGFGELPFELLLALPYLVVIGALALSGRNVAYPGAYLKPYRRSLSLQGGPMEIQDRDRAGLQHAIEQARIGRSEGGVPIGGALIADDGTVLAVGHNRRVQQNSAIRHGETDALENGGRLPASVYRRSTMYTTLSPCDMCTGAILLYGIPRVVMGENRTFVGGEDYLRARGVEVVNLDSEECVELMNEFIAAHPEIWNEDIGEE